jgi:phosphoethanolamine N-methyltransferase
MVNSEQLSATGAQPGQEVNRYTRRSILRSEKMYGEGFQSPGNLTAMADFCKRLPMQPGMNILDIGSGLGGAAFYFAEQLAARVTGLDIAPAMIEISTERKIAKGLSGVNFLLGDIRDYALPEESFDLAWTRDAILYLPEKSIVWQQVHRALKPGGHLFVTDFCRRAEQLSPAFSDYVAQCQYHLQDLAHYAATLTQAGFQVTAKEDITEQFIAALEQELDRLQKNRDSFLREYDESDYRYLSERWEKKIRFCREGDFRWGLFIASKPQASAG